MRNIEYDKLSLSEVSQMARLVCELSHVGGLLMVRCADDYFERAQTSNGRERWAKWSYGEGDLLALVPTLVEIYSEHGAVLGVPKDTTVDAIHQLIDDVAPNDLAGFAIALWAATHGHLRDLNDAILAGLTENVTDKVVPATRSACV